MCKVKIGRYWLLAIGCWLLALLPLKAQKVDAFARVHMSPSKVVEKQPIKVKITAYSSTWFAEPLNFQNVQVENAFILPFARTQSGIHYINDKKYAGLEFFYLVFPYKSGEFEFPALEIKTSIPPEGDYKGIATTLNTVAKKFIVDPLPKGKGAPTLVAKNVYISEKWSKDLSKIKVGDVVTRTLYLKAKGTLPSFIPKLEVDEPDLVSIYEKQPALKDLRDDKDANGLRVETYAYLFEKEGEVIIPELNVAWWNPLVKRKYEKSIKSIPIIVSENPHLGLVASVKDSLSQLKDRNASIKTVKTWRDYVPIAIDYSKIALSLAVIAYLLFTLSNWLIAKRKKYIGSEAYYFRQLKKKQDFAALYSWYDVFRIEQSLPPQIQTILDIRDIENKNWALIVKQISNARRKRNKETSTNLQYRVNPR